MFSFLIWTVEFALPLRSIVVAGQTDSIKILKEKNYKVLSGIDSLGRTLSGSSKAIIVHDTILIQDTSLILKPDTVFLKDTIKIIKSSSVDNSEKMANEDWKFNLLKELSIWKIFISIFLVLLAGWINWRVNKFYAKYKIVSKFKHADFFKIIFHLLIWIIAIYIIFTLIIVPSYFLLIASTIAFLILLILGSTDFVRNVIGGITILIDRPFNYGDWIKVGPYYGKVLTKNFRSVEISTMDDSIVNIPNMIFLKEAVENLNVVSKNKQVNFSVKVPKSIDVIEAKKILYEVASTSIYNSTDKPVEITFKGISSEGFNEFDVKAFVFDAKYENELKTNILETSIRCFNKF